MKKCIYTLYDVLSLCEHSGCEVYKLTHSEGKYIKIPPVETYELWDLPVKKIKVCNSNPDEIIIYCDAEFEGYESLKDIIIGVPISVVDFQNNPDKFNDDNFESMWAKENRIIIRTFTGLDKLNEEIEKFNERVSKYGFGPM